MKQKTVKKLSSSIEDYLESIYVLNQSSGTVRVKDVSAKLEVSMPSVHQALHVMSDAGLINHENYGYVELTEKGRKAGKKIWRSHRMLTKFFNEILGVPLSRAEEDACKMEHDISSKTLERLVSFIDFVESYPHKEGPDWLKSFKYFYKTGKRSKECDERIKEKLKK
ncbi:MAG: metal-dependent transcriptional regulator [Elusimicrobiota bacterium]|nr:metal-dependent transcriptional regulator [Elusimicrobiota bacterium]